jgi:hypothetical protein
MILCVVRGRSMPKMTEDEARIFLLEDELDHARQTILFMHGCLTDDTYQYRYPEHTERRLQKIATLIGPNQPGCLHSFYQDGCEECEQRTDHMRKLNEAKDTLSLLT